jgi:probable HAF family extracellular repeat protein
MSTLHPGRRTIARAAFTLLTVLATTGALAAPPAYLAHELHAPKFGTLQPNAMNNAGVVVGRTHGEYPQYPSQGVVASGMGSVVEFTALGTDVTEPLAVSDTRWVAGRYYDYGRTRPRAFVRDPAGNVLDPFASELSMSAEVNGVNAAGTAVGLHYANADIWPQAFVWSAGTVTWLGALDGIASIATAINDNGAIAGYGLRGVHYFAFRHEDGVMTELPHAFENQASGDDQAFGINAAGTVVGGCHQGVTVEVACQWPRGAPYPQAIGGLGGHEARALSINTAGVAVGEARDIWGDLRAVLYTRSGTRDLNTVATLPPGVWLHTAVSINDRGWIVVNGHDKDLQRHFLLEPVTTP